MTTESNSKILLANTLSEKAIRGIYGTRGKLVKALCKKFKMPKHKVYRELRNNIPLGPLTSDAVVEFISKNLGEKKTDIINK